MVEFLYETLNIQHPIEPPLFWLADNFSLPFIMAKIQMVFLIAAFPPFQVFTLKIPFSKWPSGQYSGSSLMIVKDGIQLVEFISTLLPIVEYLAIYQKLLPGKMTDKYDLFYCFFEAFLS